MPAWPALLASVALLTFMGRSLATGRIPFTGDLLHFHYPLRDFYARQLAAGQPFDWMPGLFAGFYVVGEGQLGGYHPLHWLLYRLLPLDRAFAIELVIGYPFLFAGTWLWLRRACGNGAAAFGAMAATFCGFTLVHGVHPNIVGVLAHVPWVLWALDGVVARLPQDARLVPDRRGVALIGLLVGSQLLLGHPQSVWFTALIGAAYAVHLMGAFRPWRWRVGVTLAAGGALALAVGAVQLLPTLDAVAHSTRPSDPGFATQYSLRPLHLLGLLHPYLFWGRVARWNEVAEAPDEYGIYGGGVVLALALWWLARMWSAPRMDRLTRHAAVFALVGLWLATGRYGGLYYLQTWLPLVGQFRAPIRYTLFAQWALAVLAALAIAHLARRSPEPAPADRRATWAMWVLTAAAAVSALWLAGASASSLAVWVGPLVLAASAALVTLAVRGVRIAVVALVLLAAADQAVYGLAGVVAWQDFVTRQEAIGFLDTNSFLPRAGEGRLLRGNFPDLYLLADHRLLDGYVAIAPARQLDYHQPNALRVAQVDYAHADFFGGAPPPADARARDRGWFQLAGALPRARLVSEARISAAPATDIADIDVMSTALVARELSLGGGPPGTASLTADLPGDITVAVEAPAPQLLVVSETFDEGWRATVDDQPLAVERVNGDFLGIVVPQGGHEVQLWFRPFHLVAGLWVSVIAGSAALAGLWWASRRR